jgi:acyl-CoA reductase-like NAD-dependent aldehyde dehydrogenase
LRRLFLELPNINGDLETGSGISCGNTVVLKPAESTPISILVLMELIGDILPGVVNIVNGFGAELGRALVTNKKVSNAFTGSTTYRSFSDAHA